MRSKKELSAGKVCGIIYFLLLFLISLPTLSIASQSGEHTPAFEELHLVWSADYGKGEQVYFSEYSGKSWTSPLQVSRSDQFVFHAASASGNDKRIWVLWTEAKKDDNPLLFSVFTGNRWTRPDYIFTQTSDNRSTAVVVDSDNTPVIAWEGSTDSTSDVYYSSWLGSKWDKPRKVNAENDVPDIGPELIIDENNSVFLTYRTYVKGKYVVVRKRWESRTKSFHDYPQKTLPRKPFHIVKSQLPELPRQVTQLQNATLFFRFAGEAGSLPASKL